MAGTPMPAPAPRFGTTQGTVGAVGEVGADTDALLVEVGYSPDEVAELRASGVVD